MKLLIATKNKHKIEEIKGIFSCINICIEFISLLDLDDHDEVDENGKTFEENAFIKAKYYYDKYHIPTISDDSGLCVKALNGEPGIYSSRYSGGSDQDNINKLLLKLSDVSDRRAFFICVICYYDGNPHFFKGIVEGNISEVMVGTNGFGYDPIFIVDGLNKSMSELDSTEKNLISHRYKALIEFKKYFYVNILKSVYA